MKEKPRTFFPRHPPPPKSSTALDIYMQMPELFEDKKLSARIRCDWERREAGTWAVLRVDERKVMLDERPGI